MQREALRGDQERERKKEEQQRAITAAEDQVNAAETALQEAQIKRDDDWQRINTGGRVLKQSYFDRVDKAKARVEAAKSDLRKARSGR
jgi:hypothetical protein